MAQDNHAVTHVMVDIETLGTKPGAAIVQIGAVVFDPITGELSNSFSCDINPESSVAAGLKLEVGTVQWWIGQGKSPLWARSKGEQLCFGLGDFAFWMADVVGNSERRIWSHGASFDPVLLQSAYEACGLKVPWSHRDLRDTRTIYDLAGIDLRLAGEAEHDGLADARAQANAVCLAYRTLGLAGAAHG